MRRLVTVGMFVSLASCSTVLMRKAPKRDPGTRPVPCSESSAFSSVDGIGSGLSAIGAAMLLGKGLGPGTDMEERVRLVPLGALLAITTVAYGWSAFAANAAAERCRHYNAATPAP
jgi:hypothetical protein